MNTIFKSLLIFVVSLFASNSVQAQDYSDPKYLAGAVPEEKGYVVFRQHFDCPGKTQKEIFDALNDYTVNNLLKSKIRLPQCRVTQATREEGTIAASMEETLTFKSTNWILDTARFFFQVVFEAKDGGFDAMLRRIHYIYEPMEVHGVETGLTAEDWITDREALNKKGQLRKVGGKKFRRATIDRKDQLFENAYKAVMKN
ncbi:MAG: DUF4468 domain-containing protein [Bacteroidales bacterium]|nr:DUF4468 domain-containing protein [Bacteroidales bacterium]